LRYFFHIVCESEVFEDEIGHRFYCCDDSVAHATRIASELGHDGHHYMDCAVRVLDERQKEVVLVPVSCGNDHVPSR
jgi:hypothetical protein